MTTDDTQPTPDTPEQDNSPDNTPEKLTPEQESKETWQGMLLKPDNTYEDVTITGYKDLQAAIGGFFEPVHLVAPLKHPITNEVFRHQGFIMWVDEEYTYKYLDMAQWNHAALGLCIWGGRQDLLTQGVLGSVVLSGPATPSGHTTSVPEPIRILALMAIATVEREIILRQMN